MKSDFLYKNEKVGKVHLSDTAHINCREHLNWQINCKDDNCEVSFGNTKDEEPGGWFLKKRD